MSLSEDYAAAPAGDEEFDDGPGMVECSECGTLIPDDDTGNLPYCGECWKLFGASS